jgi:phage FluMu protein Com
MEIQCPKCKEWYDSPIPSCPKCKTKNPTYIGRIVYKTELEMGVGR